MFLDSLASSANRNNNALEKFMTDGRSLTYIRKSSGSRMLP